MTEPPASSPASSPVSRRERPGGYTRSSNGLVGALVATVVVVLAFVGLRGLNRDNDVTPNPSVDWRVSLRAAQADGRLQLLAPTALPSGWRATSARYTTGDRAAWHLGLLTSKQKYVGVEIARDDLDTVLDQHVNGRVSHGRDVTIGSSTWQVYTGSAGDYALARTQEHQGVTQVELVVGAASPATIRHFTATLTTR